MKVCFVATLFVLTACVGTVGARPIPEPFHKQMADLQSRNLEIEKQVQDLQQQINVLCAEQQRNNQRLQTLSVQAVHAMGVPDRAYVDLNNLTIKQQ